MSAASDEFTLRARLPGGLPERVYDLTPSALTSAFFFLLTAACVWPRLTFTPFIDALTGAFRYYRPVWRGPIDTRRRPLILLITAIGLFRVFHPLLKCAMLIPRSHCHRLCGSCGLLKHGPEQLAVGGLPCSLYLPHHRLTMPHRCRYYAHSRSHPAGALPDLVVELLERIE